MVRIQVTPYYIQIIAESYDPGLINLLNAVKGISCMRAHNTYRCSLHKLPEILQEARNITSADQIADKAIRQLYEEELHRRVRTKLLKDLGPDLISTTLWPHQCLGVELAQVNRRYNFYYDTRTGKTRMCLQILYDRLKSGQARRCLVICPSAIIQAWLSDAREFPSLRLVAFYGDIRQRDKALVTPAHIVLWATEHVAKNIELLKLIDFDVCIFDESSKLKNYRTEIAAATVELSKHIPSWYNLSATPAPNGLHEYYTQMLCVDQCVFSPYITHFQNKYFSDTSRSKSFKKLVIRPDMAAEFKCIIEDYSIYVDQSVMPMAGKEWIDVPFKLKEETYRVYDEMCTESAVLLQDCTIVADMSAAVRAKLNQITSGFILSTEARKLNAISRRLNEEATEQEVYELDDNTKLKVLLDLLNKHSGEKVVIWANYAHEFEMIERLLGNRARYIRGGTSIEEKEQYIYKEFKKGDLQYLVCHPASVSMGINLTEAHIAIYYSLNDSWEYFKQSSERIAGHISVQPHKCTYYILLAEGTVNELIHKNLFNKRDQSTGLLEHLKARSLNGQ